MSFENSHNDNSQSISNYFSVKLGSDKEDWRVASLDYLLNVFQAT